MGDILYIRNLYYLAMIVSVSTFVLAAFSFFYTPTAENAQCGGTSEKLTATIPQTVHGNNATGKEIFETNCKQCHALDKVVVGPALTGITQRREKAWIYDFIHNSQNVIKSGDPYAVSLFDKFSQTTMPPFPDLSENEIDSLLDYIEPVDVAK